MQICIPCTLHKVNLEFTQSPFGSKEPLSPLEKRKEKFGAKLSVYLLKL